MTYSHAEVTLTGLRAREQGEAAALSGASRDSCPYGDPTADDWPRSRHAWSWLKGYDEATSDDVQPERKPERKPEATDDARPKTAAEED